MQLVRRLGCTFLSFLSTSTAMVVEATRNIITNCFTAMLEISDCTAKCLGDFILNFIELKGNF